MDKITLIREYLHRLGIDLIRYHPEVHPLARRMRLLAKHRIDMVFDVGANTGQFAREIRTHGYHGPIVSFEPMTEAFRILSERFRPDPLWKGENFALGETEGQARIHISQNSFSSSILDILPSHVRSAPASSCSGQETINVRTLDSVISGYSPKKFYVKIDTQGFEDRVLNGAQQCLHRIVGIQIEMSFVPLYEGQVLFLDLFKRLTNNGFTLMALEPGFADPGTDQLLQADGIFYRSP